MADMGVSRRRCGVSTRTQYVEKIGQDCAICGQITDPVQSSPCLLLSPFLQFFDIVNFFKHIFDRSSYLNFFFKYTKLYVYI